MTNRLLRYRRLRRCIGPMLTLALTLLGSNHAHAQSQNPASGTDNWQYEVMPYLWATRMKGDVQAGPLPSTSVDMKFADILETLDFGFMTAFEARKNRWGLLLDGMYMKVSDSASASRSDIGLTVDARAQIKQSMLAGAVAYRAIEGSAPVDIIGGIRYNRINVEAKIDATLFGQTGTLKRSGSKDWVDPYIGARVTLPISDKWKGIGYLDIGGSGAGSDLTWQGMTGLMYTYSPSTTINMGYRYMKVNYDDGGFKYDMANDGLYLGVAMKF